LSGGHGGTHRGVGDLDLFARSAYASTGLFVQSPMRVSREAGVLRHQDKQLVWSGLLYAGWPWLRTGLRGPVWLRFDHFG